MNFVSFPGNVSFGGTISAPQFVSNQQIIAPVAAGTASTLTISSISSQFASLSTAYTATLSVGTLLNFVSSGSIGTNLNLSGTVTALTGNISTLIVGSLVTNFFSAATLSAGTYLNVVFNQSVTSAGTTSSSYTMGTLAVAGGASFNGTITAAALGINQTLLSYPLDVNGSARVMYPKPPT